MRVHDRMPVILATEAARRWIEPGPLPAELLVPYPAEEMTAWRLGDDAKNSRIEPHPGMASRWGYDCDGNDPMANLSDTFNQLAQWTAHHAGRPAAFALAVGAIVVWLLSGPIFQWSDTWQLVINTGTTIVTFLMVFLIQNTQNRDTAALQLKIDELIRANEKARNRLLRLEEMSEEEMNHVKDAFVRLAMEDTSIIDEREGRSRRDAKQ